MSSFANYLAPVAMAAVTLVLCLGLFNMLRGGSPNTSQRLMRWRVGLQAVAVLLLMTVVYFKTH